jgi:hypothetical protein
MIEVNTVVIWRIAGQLASLTVERLHEFQARAKNGATKPGTMTVVALNFSS